MEFENQQINTDNLPDFVDTFPEKPDKDYLMIMYLTRGIFLIVAALLVTIGSSYLPNDEFPILKPVILVFLLTFIFLNFITTNIAFKKKSFGVRQKDIIYRTGFLYSSVTIIPFNRIQHIEVTIGPVEKLFKLATLKIYTAGGAQSDLKIPGLKNEKAHKIKSFVISKTSLHEEY